MKLKKWYLIILFVIIFIVLIYILFFPKFKLENKIGEVNKEYNPTIKVYNLFHKFNDVKIKSNVDNGKTGTYKVKCEVKFLFFNLHKTFKVNIVDKEKPLIELKGNNPSYVCPNKKYIEEGYTAIDNYDGDLTEKVIINEDFDKFVYSVKDTSDNEFKVERKIIFEDQESPVIELIGDNNISLYLGNQYTEPGYSAIDNCDGDLTDKVKVQGNVDVYKLGSYVIKYEVSDSFGNTSIAERTVTIKRKPNTYGDGVIYLTFDDGSSYLTGRILDILKEENIKATFFIVSVNNYTKRAHEEGHTIALHSSTHKYSYIYSSKENYFSDLENISNQVYNAIGVKPNIIRFPGGSSNTVSRNYRLGIMTELAQEVLNRGYVYFDWNVSANDAGIDGKDSQKIYYNVVNSLSHNKTNVVLMHDSATHVETVNALRNIISYGKAHGYTFKAITEDTPVVIHSINN